MNAPSVAVMEQLNKAKLLHNLVLEKHPEGTYTGDLRNHLFVALYDIVLEHHGAIITLVESGQHYGSALALWRPLIETSLRAFWTLYCVEEEHLIRITKNEQQFPDFKKCQVAVVKHFAGQKHLVSYLTSAFVDQLNGLTHTGMEAIQFRIGEDLEHRPTYPDKTICTLLKQASMFLTRSALAHIHMVEGTGHTPPPKSDELTEMYVGLFKPSG